ncbi:hypothetical protein L1887_61850 [Cichorium endivia]|nr:hypothetical protein L1887_61850 [Cichorium endivia]
MIWLSDLRPKLASASLVRGSAQKSRSAPPRCLQDLPDRGEKREALDRRLPFSQACGEISGIASPPPTLEPKPRRNLGEVRPRSKLLQGDAWGTPSISIQRAQACLYAKLGGPKQATVPAHSMAGRVPGSAPECFACAYVYADAKCWRAMRTPQKTKIWKELGIEEQKIDPRHSLQARAARHAAVTLRHEWRLLAASSAYCQKVFQHLPTLFLCSPGYPACRVRQASSGPQNLADVAPVRFPWHLRHLGSAQCPSAIAGPTPPHTEPNQSCMQRVGAAKSWVLCLVCCTSTEHYTRVARLGSPRLCFPIRCKSFVSPHFACRNGRKAVGNALEQRPLAIPEVRSVYFSCPLAAVSVVVLAAVIPCYAGTPAPHGPPKSARPLHIQSPLRSHAHGRAKLSPRLLCLCLSDFFGPHARNKDCSVHPCRIPGALVENELHWVSCTTICLGRGARRFPSAARPFQQQS